MNAKVSGCVCEELDATRSSPPSNVVILGCNGRMGHMLMEKASACGIKMRGLDLPFADGELQEACRDTELAILCVPARNLEDLVKKLIPHLPRTAILADITSVKEKPMRLMEDLWPGKIVGTHPLFGPLNETGADLPVALVKGKNASMDDVLKVAAFFTAWGCRAFTCSAARHDQAMARIQNMNFITNLAYFATLAGQEDLLPFLTPSFERRKKAAAKMLTEDADMFSGLFEANEHSHEAVREYRKMLNVAASGDIDLLLRKAQWWWKDDSWQEKELFKKSD